ncbi:MAG: hypothetical protein JW904_00500 [Spirochaetales bacterium]|nr:hypothetical protein [Spirochaetales bacterium]
MKVLTKKALEKLFQKIEEFSRNVFGEYDYKGVRIIVKKPTILLNRERSRRLYEYRRTQGLCVHCGIKVKDKNPLTNRTYRYCTFHREMELKRKKQNRNKKK